MNVALPRRRNSRCAAWLLLGLFACTSRAPAAPAFERDAELVERVLTLIDRRLAVMPEVAAIKFQQQKAITDPAREQVVIEQSVADARTLHLDADAARAFFTVQIAMARVVQEALFARWRAGAESPPRARDLVKELRPELDQLGRELLPAVYRASAVLADTPPAALATQLARLRRYAGITDAHLTELSRALTAMRITAPPTWDSLQRVRVLRVGTTGDYAPFSEERGGTLGGLDIELATRLAAAWGVSVVFVRTSWPTLMDDLQKQRFDLAASGISVTDERRRGADFSQPYHVDGKTPIARRENAARFSSLGQIDRPGVRVIVNPGGTNERFVREHLTRATIVLHPDNRTIFDELVAGRADVMITDGIEVRLQERRHPELRGTRSEPFTHTGKAFLLARDSGLTTRVNAWLETQLAERRVAAALTRALETSP